MLLLFATGSEGAQSAFLAGAGVDNLLAFDFLAPPPSQSAVRALEQLHALGALDADARLTRAIGTLLCELPLAPPLGKCLLASAALGCSQEVLTICAMLSVQSYWAGSRWVPDRRV